MASRQEPRSEKPYAKLPAEADGTERARPVGQAETQTAVVSPPETGERTDVIPRALPPPPSPTKQATEDGRRAGKSKKPALRRVKRTVANIDLWSVLKLSLFFYLVGFLLWILFVSLVYRVLQSFGVFETIEEFIGHPGVRNAAFDINLGSVERYAALIGAFFVVLGCIANLFVAILYNLFSSVFGGLQLTFIERVDQ